MFSSTPKKQFRINRPSFSRHYEITNPSSQSKLYYVDISTYSPSKPDLTIHTGGTSYNPVVAVAHIPHISGEYKIGLGDPAKFNSVKWEKMIKETFVQEHYFTMGVPDTNNNTIPPPPYEEAPQYDDYGSKEQDQGREKQSQAQAQPWQGSGLRRQYVWKRTGTTGFGGKNRKLQDVQTKEVVATFTRDSSLSRGGVLTIHKEMGRECDMMVLTTYLAIHEKTRRTATKAGASGGGGAC